MNLSTIAICFLSAVSLFELSGCIGFGCGVAPVQSHSADGGATATVDGDGRVTFAGIPVGMAETFAMPIMETADTDETIVSGAISGTDAAAFQILSSFPIQVPDHQQVTIDVRFTPTMAGEAAAELDLQTEKMGSSRVEMKGDGV